MSTAKEQSITESVKSIAASSQGRDEKLQDVSELLHRRIDVFDWVGFYIVDPDSDRELVLGPYVGEATDHTRIPFGKGVCGQAADTEKTFVVQDVKQESNYLACSAHVQAEIVVPVMKRGSFVAELDIDSHTKDSITEEHQQMLEEVCNIIAEIF